MDNDVDHVDDDDFDETDSGLPWPQAGPGYPPPPGGPHRPGTRRALALAAVALIAGAAGYAAVAVVRDAIASPVTADAAPSTGASPGSSGGLPRSGAGGGLPAPGSGQTVQLMIGGRVTAVSAESITIGRGDRAVTATVNRRTAVAGQVHGIGGIKVGDLVAATITGTGGKLTAVSIQDPASIP